MRIKLNLLSNFKKTRLKQMTQFLFLKNILEITIIASSLLAIAMLIGWLVMEDQYIQTAQSTNLVSKQYSVYNQEIKKINKSIKDINSAGAEYFAISPIIMEFAQNLPKDIKINSLDIDRRTQTLIITGTAKTREALIDYQEKLKIVSWIDGVVTPISQLFQKENVNFEFKMKLKGFPEIKNTESQNK
ncbi:MAG: hypothetical protein PHY40_00040 [Patescibacteria group bacterium]|jgi:hypothetical protein|nr:hypothetical protein [Patescibacteria group bacterium]